MKRAVLALPLAALIGLGLFLWMKRPGPSTPALGTPRDVHGPAGHEAPEDRPPHPTDPGPAASTTTPAGSLLIRVRGRGLPLPGAEVLLMREGLASRMRFQTGADGSRLILQIPAGDYAAAVTHPRCQAGDLHVTVPAGGQATADLELKPAARIFGRVSDLSGSPLPGTNVQLIDAESRLSAAMHLSARTDADGRYELPPVGPGAWTPRFRHERFKPREHDRALLVQTGTEEFEVNAVLEVGGRVAGRVVDEQGSPLAGASIIFGNEGGGGVATSDVDGRFAVYGLTEAPASGSAALKGYGTAYRRGVPANTTDVEFRLARGGTLAGRVLTEPLPEHFTVALSRFDAELGKPLRIHQKAFSASTSQGAFRVEDLAPGIYWVEVESSGYEAAEQPQVTIAAGQTSAAVTIRMNRK